MNQTERKLDKTPADQQKERAGGPPTIGRRNRAEYTPITVFVLERTASCFPMNLYLQTHTLCSLRCVFMSYFVSRLQKQPTSTDFYLFIYEFTNLQCLYRVGDLAKKKEYPELYVISITHPQSTLQYFFLNLKKQTLQSLQCRLYPDLKQPKNFSAFKLFLIQAPYPPCCQHANHSYSFSVFTQHGPTSQ